MGRGITGKKKKTQGQGGWVMKGSGKKIEHRKERACV